MHRPWQQVQQLNTPPTGRRLNRSNIEAIEVALRKQHPLKLLLMLTIIGIILLLVDVIDYHMVLVYGILIKILSIFLARQRLGRGKKLKENTQTLLTLICITYD